MKYLINGITHPLKVNRWAKIIRTNALENNPGDMVYAYAVMNALAVNPNVDFDMTGYYRFAGFEDQKIDEINETYTAFVIPLADIFSHYWAAKVLPRYTELVNKLSIPCVVPCVGARDGDTTSEDDTIVRRFVDAVLDKSAIVGVRGESTARYLSRLGYRDGRHFEVVGCPSMFMYGQTLPQLNKPRLDSIRNVAYGLNKRCSDELNEFIYRSANVFESSMCVFQYHGEFYDGFINHRKSFAQYMSPCYAHICRQIYQSGMGIFPLNRKPWFEYLRTVDLQFGARIHGVMLGILAGTPSVLFPFERRTMELAEYHGLPIVDPSRIRSGSNLCDFYEDIDFSRLQKSQDENFRRFKKFFAKNGIAVKFGHQMLESRLPSEYPDDFIKPIDACPWTERLTRLMTRFVHRAEVKAKSFKGKRWGMGI